MNTIALMKQFKDKDIDIYYSYYKGIYKIKRDDAHGDLYVFKNYSGMMQRIGLESYISFISYHIYYR